MGWSSTRRRGGSAGCAPRSSTSCVAAWRAAPIWRWMAWRAGGWSICAPWSSGVSPSATRSGVWASSSLRSASPGSRRGPSSPDPRPKRKPRSKKLPDPIAAAVGEQARGKRLELWFQDERRSGQNGALTRHWARRGSRPRQPKDQRHAAADLFAAVCPAAEKTAALVLPQVDTAAMNLHLAEIARQIDAQAHAVVILDQAGWPGARALVGPENLTLLPLPPDSPELNPVENLWQFLKHNFLNSQVCADDQAIVDACCDAWNRLRAIPGQIRAITTRKWARTVDI
jgi:DDE superfamily endonuclease